LDMASMLGGFEALSQDPVVEVEVEMEMDPLDIKPVMQEIEEYIVFLRRIPKCMLWLAWSLCLCLCRVGLIEPTIRQAMASVFTVNGTTVNFKIVVVNDLNNCGPITF
jgi:hypothetical protein